MIFAGMRFEEFEINLNGICGCFSVLNEVLCSVFHSSAKLF